MITEQEKDFFLEHGYLAVEGVLAGAHLTAIQQAFDDVWEAEGNKHVTQHGLLKYRPFIDLIEHPPILDRHRAIVGNQVQLLQYDLLRQGPHNTAFPERSWHRDFVFPGERPLAINTILFIDDIRAATGPTRASRLAPSPNWRPVCGYSVKPSGEFPCGAKVSRNCTMTSHDPWER